MGYREVVLADAPVAYWRLDEPSGGTVADSSGSGKTGTLIGGVTLGQTGALLETNTAALFNGTTGQISTTADAATVPPAAWTMEAWFKGANIVRDQYIVARHNTRPSLLVFSSGVAGVDVFDGTTHVQLAGANVANSAWHHLVATYDGTSLRLYVDGALSAGPTVSAVYQNTTPTDVWRIGGRSDFSSPAQCTIDEVALYTSALSLAKIQAHYAARTFLSGVGTASGTSTVTGVGATVRAGAGSASGSSAASGVGGSIAAGVGVSAGGSTVLGVGLGIFHPIPSPEGVLTMVYTPVVYDVVVTPPVYSVTYDQP